MSTPRSLDLPKGVRPGRIVTSRGDFAALVADPPAGDRPAVILVPGWTGSKEDFAAVLAPIARAGYQAVSIDQRGQFETAGKDDEGAYTLDGFGADLRALIAACGGRAHLVGHSFGGLVVRTAAIADPPAVASVTLLCSGPAALPAEVHPLLDALADAIGNVGLALAWKAKRAHELANGTPAVPDDIEAFLARRFVTNHPVSLQAMTRLLTSAPDLVSELRATEVPVQVVFGADDDGWPLDTQREMAARLNAPVHIIEDAGHSPAVEQPEATATTLLNFWEE
ncbi:MAG TPA: alpha/beta hydrolase [Jiangellaceae bacterium]